MNKRSVIRTRERHPSSDAVRFLETHHIIPGTDPDDNGYVLSPWGGMLVSPGTAAKEQEEKDSLWHQVDQEKEAFFELMDEVNKKLSKKGLTGRQGKKVADLRKCSWNEVASEVNKAALRWKDSPEKQGKTMILVEKLGTHSQAIQSWLGLLPGGDYGSSICGAFQLVVGAAGQYTKIEEDIFRALAKIPDHMETTRRYSNIYWKKPNQRFGQLVFNLFRATLKALHNILKFLADSKYRRVFESLVAQGGYKADITSSLEEVEHCVEAIQKEGALCQSEETRKILLNQDKAEAGINHLRDLLESHSFILVDVRDNRKALVGSDLSPYDLVNVNYNVAGDSTKLEAQKATTPQLLAQEETRAEIDNILQVLHYDENALSRDVAACRRLGYQLGQKSKSKAAGLIRNEMFQSFMRRAQSSMSLLVNGHEDLAVAEGVSPLSLVAAELSNLSSQAGDASTPLFLVNYFCAENQPSPIGKETQSPVGIMMASLIGQLLSQMRDKAAPVDLSFMRNRALRKAERLDLDTLCKVFKKLARKLPAGGILLCIIDEVPALETETYQFDIGLAMEYLSLLARGSHCGQTTFKLLATCRGRALGACGQLFEQILDMQDVEADDSADWTIATLVD